MGAPFFFYHAENYNLEHFVMIHALRFGCVEKTENHK